MKNFLKKKRKKFLLTIDDGYKSFYEYAWPYLKENQNTFYNFYIYRGSGKKWLYELEANQKLII